MRVAVHIVGGLVLVALTIGLFVKVARIEQDPTSNWSEGLIRILTFGETRTRREWIWRLRLAYGGMGVIALIGAIALLATV